MLRPFVQIQIKQITPFTYKDKDGVTRTIERKSVLNLDFVTEYIIDNGWETHTSNCKIKFPKNVLLKTEDFLFKQSGTYNVILGGVANINQDNEKIYLPPLLMRGDFVKIIDGYRFFNEKNVEQKVEKEVYNGYISKVHSGIPIEIDCEDNFYLLKRVPIGITKFSGKLSDLCIKILENVNSEFNKKNSNYPVLSLTESINDLTNKFSLGYLDIDYESMSCAMVLNKLRTQYGIESFFIGNVLYFGYPIYQEENSDSKNFFNFQNNIIEKDLEYCNKQDIVLSGIVSCQAINVTDKKTKSGLKSTKKIRLQVYVYWDVITETFKYINITKGTKIPPNEGGERHDFKFPVDLTKPAPTVQDLADFGIQKLSLYYYTGFKGSFTTFGFPFVKWNDNVNLIDKFFADRNGQYKVRRVVRKGGIKGIKQKVHLDYKLNVDIPKSVYQISML